MNHEYPRRAPWIRFAFAVAALSMTLSVGGFIDLLAFSYVTEGEQARSVITANQAT